VRRRNWWPLLAGVLWVAIASVPASADEGGQLDFPETPSPKVDKKDRKLGAEEPKPLDVRARNVDWGVGGKVQLDILYDFNAVGLEENSPFYREYLTSRIPIAGPAAERTRRIGFSPNQSRFYSYVGVPTPWGPFKAYAQINFMRSPTEIQIQLHRIFAHWAWLHIAYDYTQFLNLKTIPLTLDYEGPGPIPETRRGLAFLRIPLAKLGESSDFYLAIGAEESPTDAVLPTGVQTRDRVPAIIGRLIYAPSRVDIQIAGLYRRISFFGGGFDTKTNGWAVSAQGSIDLLEEDEAIFGVIYGKGLGAYIDDTAGLGLDAAPDGTSMRLIPAFATWLAYTHYWMVSLSSTATFGYVFLDNDFDQTPNSVGTYHDTYFASMSLIWTPWHAMDIGLEYMYGQRTVTANTAVLGQTTNHNHRLMLSVILKWEVSAKGVKKMLNPSEFRP